MKREPRRTKRYKMMVLRRAQKMVRRRTIVKERKRRLRKIHCERNYRFNQIRRKDEREYYEKRKFKNYKIRTAPVNFSIIDNCEKVIGFINELRKDYHSKRKVFVNMKDVTKVTNESLCLLLSNMMLFRDSRIDFNGNFPFDNKACRIVMESGFLEQLYVKRGKNSINNVNSPIYTHSAYKSNADIADAIIVSCSKFLWQKECNCSGVYNAFIELMANTIEHADEIEGKQKWWVTATKDEETEKVTFSFVDYGRGIIKTLTNADQKRYKNVVERLLAKWTGDEAMLLKEVMEGALTLSEKDGTYYGNGLNSIYQDMKAGQLDNVIIISNDIFADVKNGKYNKMNESFPGTFICWEINKDTKHEIISSNPIHTEVGTEAYQSE